MEKKKDNTCSLCKHLWAGQCVLLDAVTIRVMRPEETTCRYFEKQKDEHIH